MLVALRDSLVDASWPVRDRACIAIGRYIRSVWNRNLDLHSSGDVRLIPIPTTQSILEYDTQHDLPVVAQDGEELSQEELSQEKLTVMMILQECVEILLSYLHTDPFRPVRESAAIAIVDCILSPLTQLTSAENPLKVCSLPSSSPLSSVTHVHNTRRNSKNTFGKRLKIIYNLTFSLRPQLLMRLPKFLYPLPSVRLPILHPRDVSTKRSVSFQTLLSLNSCLVPKLPLEIQMIQLSNLWYLLPRRSILQERYLERHCPGVDPSKER